MNTTRTFAWDEDKAAENVHKHHVPFAHATRVFDDPLGLDVLDGSARHGEKRWNIVGMIDGRLFLAYPVITHTHYM